MARLPQALRMKCQEIRLDDVEIVGDEQGNAA
jgi:hypothetical protein